MQTDVLLFGCGNRSLGELGIDPVSIVAGGATLVTKLISGGGITPGIIDRKLAAGILAARSLGYSDLQISMEPIRGIIDQIGQYPQSIKNVVNGPVELFQSLVKQQGIILPQPVNPPSKYTGTPEGGPPVAPIIGSVYGPEIEALSRSNQTITVLPPPVTPAQVQQLIEAKQKAESVLKGISPWWIVGGVAVLGVGAYLLTR